MNFRWIFVGLLKVLKWTFISLILVYVTLYAINAKDEEPSPEFISIQTLPKINPDPNNGYLALVGMNAPVDEDVLDYGAQWVDTYNAADTSMAIQRASVSFLSGKLRIENIKFQGDREELCNPSKMACISQALLSAATWRKLANDNQILVARERRLIEFERYEESYFPPNGVESVIPSFSIPSRLLVLDLIALDVAEGRLETALSTLEARIAFDRRALFGSHDLVNALVTTSWLKQDYALLAEIVGKRSAELVAQESRLVRMTELFTIDQIRDIALRMHEGNARHSVNLFSNAFLPAMESMMGEPAKESSLVSIGKMLLAPLHQSQATQNYVAHLQSSFLLRLNEFSPESADVWIDMAAGDTRKAIEGEIFSWSILYNPVGKINVYGMEQGFRDSYTVRLSDLAGIIRLARLQVEMVTDGVADADIPARISSNKALYDIYTGKPMGAYAGERTLYFDTHRDGKPERIHVGI